MMWFNGSIQSAINQVKSSSSFLLVFIQGDDDLSKRYEKFLNDGIKYKSEDFVAIKISHNSEAYEQLKRIYVIVPVPSVFLIGNNGLPFEIVCSSDPSNLNDAITEAIAKKKKQNGTQVGNSSRQNGEIQPPDDKIIPSQRLNSSSGGRNIARIQFRLPSNETRSWEFPYMCTLHDVRIYLMETLNLRQGFKLLRTFPGIAFTSDDDNKTLVDLSLTPNATLIVVPLPDNNFQSRIRKIVANNNFISSIISVIFQPVIAILNYVSRFFQGSSDPSGINQTRTGRPNSRKKSKKISTSNIHGFAFDESDTDSDMNTDNGNSTQQK